MAPTVSFRDPGGRCVVSANRVLRFVTPAHLPRFEEFLNSNAATKLFGEKCLISTTRLPRPQVEGILADGNFPTHFAPEAVQGGGVFEHEAVWFPSYPYEWIPEMLQAAGQLTVQIAQTALPEGFGIKDATPFNILFRGADPIFVDLLSFERRNPEDPIWKPYAQFVRTFLLPLLAQRTGRIPLADVFLSRRDGFAPEDVYSRASWWQRLRPPFLNLVTLPVWLSRRQNLNSAALYRERHMSPDKARFVLEALFARLQRTLRRLAPPISSVSNWSCYMETHSYDQRAFAEKEKFVQEAFDQSHPKTVLDLGTNTGHFSLLAASQGADVVAIDTDAASLAALWARARHRQAKVLPLLVNLARPTPASGWRNAESLSFIERARGKFDLVLMLAVLHHLLVSERIPLDEILDLAAELATDRVIIEFVPPEDPMFQAGHLKGDRYDLDWPELVRPGRTLVVYMGISSLPEISRQLIAHGMPATTPAACIRHATLPDQHVIVDSIAGLPARLEAEAIKPPALLIIGGVVSLRQRLNWFDPSRD